MFSITYVDVPISAKFTIPEIITTLATTACFKIRRRTLAEINFSTVEKLVKNLILVFYFGTS